MGYVRRPKGYVWRDSDDVWLGGHDGGRESVTVCEQEPEDGFSGLYDADGVPLYRQRRRPIGFLWREE